MAIGLNCYTRITDRAIVISGPLDFHERRYSFDQVESIGSVARYTAPSGKSVLRPHYAIRFKDGTTWTTRDGLREPDPLRDCPMIEFVADAGGKPIESIESIEDLGREGGFTPTK